VLCFGQQRVTNLIHIQFYQWRIEKVKWYSEK
jgi:hypothetical protein